MTAWRPDLFPDARPSRPAKRLKVRAPGLAGSNPPWVRPARLPFILSWRAVAVELLLIGIGVAHFITTAIREER